MALPKIVANHLFPLGALPPAAPPPSPPPGGHGLAAPPAHSLNFTMYRQEQANWCWSAVAVSVSQFYSAASPWNSQCQLASQELGRTCCPAGNDPHCDVPWYLDRALTRTNNYNTFGSGAAPFAGVQTEVSSGRPLGVRIGWSGGGGHFVVLSGYSTTATNQYVTVEDPIFMQSTLTYAAFCTTYQGSGVWTHSFWTQP